MRSAKVMATLYGACFVLYADASWGQRYNCGDGTRRAGGCDCSRVPHTHAATVGGQYICAPDAPSPRPAPLPVAPPTPRPRRPEPPRPQEEPTNCPEGMVLIPAGTFTMGDESVGATPLHTVTLRAFCIDRTEVTVAQYRQCPSGRCSAPNAYVNTRGNSNFFCNWGRPGADEHPVNCVDWNQARAWCQWRGGDLPTEDQWEYAARGTAARPYPWGPEAPSGERTNLCGSECVAYASANGFSGWGQVANWTDRWGATAPVGELPAAGNTPDTGLVGMAGNVWEWTRTPLGGYTSSSGAATRYVNVDRTLRVLRGGCWYNYDPSWARAGLRLGSAMTDRSLSVGFRCVREGR